MKILQIIPAQPGWNVAYKAGTCKWSPGHDEAGGVEFVPIACWALVQDEAAGGARVVPMTGGESGAALVPRDIENTAALGVSPPGRRPRDWVPKLRRSDQDTRKLTERAKSARPRPASAKTTPLKRTQPEPKAEKQAAPVPGKTRRADPKKVEEVREAIETPPEPRADSSSDLQFLDTASETQLTQPLDPPPILLEEAQDASYTVSEPAPDGIPSGDVLDLDF